jgi:transmembrane sensor
MEHPLLARYLAGECSETEVDEVRGWIAASPDNCRAFEQFQMLWRASPTEPAWDVGAALAKVEQALRGRPSLTLVPVSAPTHAAPRSRRWVVPAQVAAVLALVTGGVIATGVVRSGPSGTVSSAAFRTATTPRGQRAAFHLPDGTSVMLGPASTLRYSEAFGVSSREVALVGEAYFEVRHDKRRPFVVRAGDLVATDLGTEFTVAAYPEDADARVVVRAGLVGLRSAAGPVDAERVLKPGDLGRLDSGGKPMVERADTLTQFAWTRGELVLPGVTLREAAAQLGRWYDVEVRLASPEIGTRRLEASFEHESVADVFRLIAASLQLQVESAGRVYTLRAK